MNIGWLALVFAVGAACGTTEQPADDELPDQANHGAGGLDGGVATHSVSSVGGEDAEAGGGGGGDGGQGGEGGSIPGNGGCPPGTVATRTKEWSIVSRDDDGRALSCMHTAAAQRFIVCVGPLPYGVAELGDTCPRAGVIATCVRQGDVLGTGIDGTIVWFYYDTDPRSQAQMSADCANKGGVLQ